MRLLVVLVAILPTVIPTLLPMMGGGGCCCQQQQSCCPPPQPCCCCPPPPMPCCCGGGGGGGCGGGCGGGGFGRKKREIGHVRGRVEKQQGVASDSGHCNSVEISELMRKHMNNTSPFAAKSAIYQDLAALYPDQSFTVMCVDGVVSYQADSERFCIEGNLNHNCYVFMI
ncbi:hypothetical protein Q1695_006479 [Nippostrongylus brasiliensis]|nr:hypothetical protein Q1695_006479 [Nippostrongylus brasiliensis]